MSAISQGKTKEYTRKAINDYRAKHDFLNITLDKGEKDKMLSVGLDNKAIAELVRAEYQRRINGGEASETPKTETVDEENDIPFF